MLPEQFLGLLCDLVKGENHQDFEFEAAQVLILNLLLMFQLIMGEEPADERGWMTITLPRNLAGFRARGQKGCLKQRKIDSIAGST